MSTGKQTPLGVNVMSGMVQGKGFWVNKPTAAIVGTSHSAESYTFGTLVTNSSLFWATYAINDAYVRGYVNTTTYFNLINMGSSTIPALGNSRPPNTYKYAGSPFWAAQYNTVDTVANKPATQWGYIRLYPWQGYNEFDYNNTLALSGMYNDFCGSFISAGSFIEYSNKSIMSAQNSLTFLKGTYSNMNDLISADVTNVSLSPQAFGKDLINLGKALDLSTIWTFGYPSNLLATLKKYNALTASVSVALLSTGLTTNDIDNISGNTNVTKEQQQKTYAAFLIITGVDLAEILVSLNCNTQGLVTLADLLDVRKMFPNSYQTLTVPLYNAVPGPTNSKTYYPIFATNAVSPTLTTPAVAAQVGTVIPPLPPLVVETPPPIPAVVTPPVVIEATVNNAATIVDIGVPPPPAPTQEIIQAIGHSEGGIGTGLDRTQQYLAALSAGYGSLVGGGQGGGYAIGHQEGGVGSAYPTSTPPAPTKQGR